MTTPGAVYITRSQGITSKPPSEIRVRRSEIDADIMVIITTGTEVAGATGTGTLHDLTS
jgi:hypothetical protein